MENLINRIQDAAFEVRRNLTFGYLEAIYHNALMHELRVRGIPAKDYVKIPVFYKNERVGEYEADIVVDDRVILEIKAVRELAPAHEAQLVNYLTATGINDGVLINYGGEKFKFHRKTRIYHG